MEQAINSVLGVHSERIDLALPLLKRAGRVRLLVSLDLDPGRLPAARPYADLIVARYDPQGTTQNTYLGRGAALADLIVAGVQPVAHLCDMVACLNEPDVSTPERAALVAQTLVDACAVLRAAGIRTVGPNCSTGTPALPTDPGGPAILDALLPGVAAVDFYGGHEYSKPSMRDGAGYLIGRTSKILDYYASKGVVKQAILSEVGIDFDLPNGAPSGYRANGVPDAAYLADLQWASGVWATDPRIRGAALFQAGSYQQFASFDVTGTPLGGMLAAWLRAQNAAPTKGLTVLQGIDVSNVNGPVDWPMVAAARQFSCIKRSEGVGWADPDFTANWQGAKAAGLTVAAYHFARPDLGNTPEAEAGYFVRQLPPLAVGDSLALDLEVGDGDLSGWALRWLQAVQNVVGFAPWLYSYPDFLVTRSLGTVALAAYPLWYASYQASEPAPPGQWRQIAVWQATDARAVPGVAAPVDGDVTDLTVAQLKALGKPAPVALTTGGSLDALAQEALAYYTQTGVKVDPTHGVFLHAMLPLYALWKQMAAEASPACAPDLIKPGPLVLPEYGSLWGTNRPAACVRLSNGVIGVYQAPDGSWDHPFRASV